MTDKKREKLEWIAKLKKVAAEKRPQWRAHNVEARERRRAKLEGYAALAKEVEEHHPVFDATVRRLSDVLVRHGVVRGTPRLVPEDLGEYASVTTVFAERIWEWCEGDAQVRVVLSPADDFFRGGVLLQHTIEMLNTTWYPDKWVVQWDLPVDLGLVGDGELEAYALLVAQFRRRVDLLDRYVYQDDGEARRSFERVAERMEQRLLGAGLLKGLFEDFVDYARGSLQGDLGELHSIILRPPNGGAASLSIGPSDSKRSCLSFGLDMAAYDPITPAGARNLELLVGLVAVLVKDNMRWSARRNVDCLQYDGW